MIFYRFFLKNVTDRGYNHTAAAHATKFTDGLGKLVFPYHKMCSVPFLSLVRDDRRHGRSLQAADDFLAEHPLGDDLRRIPAHVGEDRHIIFGTQVGHDEFQQRPGDSQGGRIVLETGTVGDQAALRGQDLSIRQAFETIIALSGTGGDQVGDQVCVADQGSDLQCTFGGDELNRFQSILTEESLRLDRELGRHPQRTAQPGLLVF